NIVGVGGDGVIIRFFRLGVLPDRGVGGAEEHLQARILGGTSDLGFRAADGGGDVSLIEVYLDLLSERVHEVGGQGQGGLELGEAAVDPPGGPVRQAQVHVGGGVFGIDGDRALVEVERLGKGFLAGIEIAEQEIGGGT